MYNLTEAYKKLEIPHEVQDSIDVKVINVPKWIKRPVHGFVYYGNNVPKWIPHPLYESLSSDNRIVFLFYNGNDAEMDSILAHEVKGHVMDSNSYKSLSPSKEMKAREHYARTVELESLLDLAEKYPENGYLDVFDTYARRAKRSMRGHLVRVFLSLGMGLLIKNKILKTGSYIMSLNYIVGAVNNFFYDKDVDYSSLIEKRNRM